MINHTEKVDCGAFVSENFWHHFWQKTFSAASSFIACGKDPRLGSMAMITTGSPPSECKKKTGCSQCRVPSKDLWYQNGAVRFKFSTDSEFDRYLQSHCGFGIPKTGGDFMLASPQVITK